MILKKALSHADLLLKKYLIIINVETVTQIFFQDSLMNRKFKRIKLICNVSMYLLSFLINFKAFLLNKSIYIFQKIITDPKLLNSSLYSEKT